MSPGTWSLLGGLTFGTLRRCEWAYLHDDGTVLLISVEVLVGVPVAALEPVGRNLCWRSIAGRKLKGPFGEINVFSGSTVRVQRGGEGQGAEHRDSVSSEAHIVCLKM